MASRSPNVYVCVGNVELWVYVTEYSLVGLDDSLEVDIDEEIVRVNVLFDEPFDLQKCRKKVPFILDMVRPVNRGSVALSILQIMRDIALEDVKAVPIQPRI